MKNKVKSISFIVFLTTVLYSYYIVTIEYMNKNYKVSYGRGLEHKFNKLKSIESNKVVVVGGSNVSFGIDSDIMERKLEMPVVNMGLHADFGTYTIIEPVLPYLKEKDVLIISREYSDKLYRSSFEVANYFGYMPFRAKLEIFKSLDASAPLFKSLIHNSQKNLLNFDLSKQIEKRQGPYSFESFRNDNLCDKSIDFLMSDKLYKSYNKISLKLNSDEDLLNYYRGLKTRLDKKEIFVCFSLPAIIDSRYDSIEMINYYQHLSEYSGIPLLSPKTYSYPPEKMFNTMYHPNRRGREDRSLGLANDIATIIGKEYDNSSSVNKYLVRKSTNPEQNGKELSFNSIHQGKYEEQKNILTILSQGKNNLNNYYRIRKEGDVFKNKNFKIILEGKSELLQDVKFRTVGGMQEWDEIEMQGNRWEFIKNNISNTFYKDGFSYAGIALKNIQNHFNSQLKVLSLEVSENTFNEHESFFLKKNEKYMITLQSSSKSINEMIQGAVPSDFIFQYPNKYIIVHDDFYIHLTDIYKGAFFKIKKKDSDIVLKGSDELIEIHALSI